TNPSPLCRENRALRARVRRRPTRGTNPSPLCRRNRALRARVRRPPTRGTNPSPLCRGNRALRARVRRRPTRGTNPSPLCAGNRALRARVRRSTGCGIEPAGWGRMPPMRFDLMTGAATWADAAQTARDVEGAGFSGMLFTETSQTPWMSIAAAATAAPSLELSTGIAVAFARSPIVSAALAWELAENTQGRFRLGLGSQVKAHVERRYGAA